MSGGLLDGAAFRLAALGAMRFPEGEALGAYLDGDAGLADFLRCGEHGCPWGVAPGSEYCETHKLDRQRAQQREYKVRKAGKGEPEPSSPECCGNPPPWSKTKYEWYDDPSQGDARAYESTTHGQCYGWPQARPLRQLGAPSRPTAKRCGQHKDAHDTGRGYEGAWRSGARGDRRVSWLYELLGQGDGNAWGRGWDAAGPLPATDRGPDEGATRPSVAHPYPWGDEGARQWFAQHPGWVNHPLPELPSRVAGRKRLTASWLRPELDRLAEIHRIRHINGYWPWGENVRVQVEDVCGGIT